MSGGELQETTAGGHLTHPQLCVVRWATPGQTASGQGVPSAPGATGTPRAAGGRPSGLPGAVSAPDGASPRARQWEQGMPWKGTRKGDRKREGSRRGGGSRARVTALVCPAWAWEMHEERGRSEVETGELRGAPAVTERHREDRWAAAPAGAPGRDRGAGGKPGRTAPAPLPVGHPLHRVEVVAHVESRHVAEVRDTQVEVEHVPSVTLHLRRHANGGVFPLLHQSQVFEQTGGFLLARAEKDSDPSLDQGWEHTVVVLRPLEEPWRFSCRVKTRPTQREPRATSLWNIYYESLAKQNGLEILCFENSQTKTRGGKTFHRKAEGVSVIWEAEFRN